jgi:hypothetical protein
MTDGFRFRFLVRSLTNLRPPPRFFRFLGFPDAVLLRASRHAFLLMPPACLMAHFGNPRGIKQRRPFRFFAVSNP